MKLAQRICPNDILDEFKNGNLCLKTWLPRGRAFFLIWLYMALVKSCLHSRGHIYYPIFMKLGQKIHPNNILEEIENDAGWLKNMAASGRGIFPYMAIVKPC
jgi:hypothetical protein